jgi:hypothetical protein
LSGAELKRILTWLLVVVVVAWVLVWGYRHTIFIPDDLVENGIAMVMVCGKKIGTGPFNDGFMQATDVAPRARVGVWGRTYKGDCNVWYHYPGGHSF